MFPPEQLRKKVSLENRIDLEQYKWSKELTQRILEINLDKELEPSADTLRDVYSQGFNIGHCGLTSRYVVKTFKGAALYYGKSKLLVGTPASPDGEHAWTILEHNLIDTTLMISIPIEKIEELGYIPEKEISPISAKHLSEYDVYDIEYQKNKIKHKV